MAIRVTAEGLMNMRIFSCVAMVTDTWCTHRCKKVSKVRDISFIIPPVGHNPHIIKVLVTIHFIVHNTKSRKLGSDT